jgi:hypothetical protein
MSIAGSSSGDAWKMSRSSWTCTSSPQSIGRQLAGETGSGTDIRTHADPCSALLPTHIGASAEPAPSFYSSFSSFFYTYMGHPSRPHSSAR